ncbi:bifunctional heparan sulfate N-deacetylase/N-sulfotransferase 3 [Biomphalaria glabrata]|uniref:[heparan sulfate]-glucosamine N-sulfotransferase n=1 Tax=Biomphalaria glabrata TaxID=6526 RepID=A0A2C9JQV7_BIOGL|nr:bifunctional heparan sulfate N-deacetylase/N-sulfotransferase 3 [Biomphalaria glabrata]
MLLRREMFRCYNSVTRLLSCKRCSLLRSLVLIFALSIVSSLFFLYRVMDTGLHVPRANPPVPHIRCDSQPYFSNLNVDVSSHHRLDDRLRVAHRALLITEVPNSKNGQRIRYFLNALRIEVKFEIKSKAIPTLTNKKSGRFAVIIFENYNTYLDLDTWSRQLVDKYCHDYRIGILSFVRPVDESTDSFRHVDNYHISFHYNLALMDFRISEATTLWRIMKPGSIWKGALPDTWTIFKSNHSTYQPLAFSRILGRFSDADPKSYSYVPAIFDEGRIDGIPKVLLGSDLNFWLNSIVMMDALSYLSSGRLGLPLERYIQVDVDDIFVGKEGIRMKVSDVEALVAAQERLEKEIDGFQFNLGYSGGFFLFGTDEEDDGDRKLIEYRHKFRWFSHMFRHEQPHKFPKEYIESAMKLNKQFAEENGIQVYGQYAVAPHHSGVYPVYEPLYSSWKEVWGVKTTSTEEYPKLLPSWKRRGFIHKGIMVLPRQTCGLFTTTVYSSDFRGGLAGLDSSIQGGEIFQTVLTTPINIFMTHLSNYGNDRLALYMLESLVKFVKCWTNFKLLSLPPVELGLKYFEMYPADKDPIWTNPCDYNRHLSIWPENKTCDKLPSFIVVGPQKTGTTALYSFLSQHPDIVSNLPTPKHFEEIQFFNTNNYYLGLDWYMDFFPQPDKPNTTLLFEKSANYFESDLAPKRVAALLPRAKIIVILMNPAKRAYSWYQHMRNHNDPTALNHTFYEVVSASDMASQNLRALHNRCLTPGLYAQHLVRWLDFFPAKQIHLVDSDELRNDPVNVMHLIQKFLHVQNYMDYSQHLRYDPAKGFFCQVLSNKQNKCLGKSKGHKYPSMDHRSEQHLHSFYRKHNINLSKLLSSFETQLPEWLTTELKDIETPKT